MKDLTSHLSADSHSHILIITWQTKNISLEDGWHQPLEILPTIYIS